MLQLKLNLAPILTPSTLIVAGVMCFFLLDVSPAASNEAVIPAQVNLDGKEYSNTQLTDAFLAGAFNFSMEADNARLPEISDKSAVFTPEVLKAGYPWIYEYVYREKGFPKYFSINKWVKPVKISTGYPNDLNPSAKMWWNKNLKFYDDEYQADLPAEILDLVKKEVEGAAPKFSAQIGLSVTYLAQKDETLEDTADIRIIFYDDSKIQPEDVSVKKTYIAKRYKRDVEKTSVGIEGVPQSEGVFLPRAMSRWGDMFPLHVGAVKFSSGKNGVDGLTYSNVNNELEKSFCFIWMRHDAQAIAGLVRECLLRSMGFPSNMHIKPYGAKTESVLSNMGWEKEAEQPSFTEVDMFLLKALYDARIKPGFDPVQVADVLLGGK